MVSGEAGKWMKGFSSRNSNGWQVADIPENSGQVSKVTEYPKWKQFSSRFKNSNTTSGKTKIINKGNGKFNCFNSQESWPIEVKWPKSFFFTY
jgi:hypothetical protein